jgi:DNA-directed RNA polymerase specialized sigma24 family protein
VVHEKLKRELEREALARLEDAARTTEDFEAVVEWWDRLDRNREHRQGNHEVGRSGIPLEWGSPVDVVIPVPTGFASWHQVLKGDFLDVIFDCPYEMHHLVEDEDISELICRLSENHKEVLYYHAVRMYDTARIAAIRGQTERNIRKLRSLLLSDLRKRLLVKLAVRDKNGLPLTTTERVFLNEHKKSALDGSKDG